MRREIEAQGRKITSPDCMSVAELDKKICVFFYFLVWYLPFLSPFAVP